MPIWTLYQEVLTKGKYRGVEYRVENFDQMESPGQDGLTRFENAQTILTKMRTGLPDELFTAVIAEEMEHALQKLNLYSQILPKIETPADRRIADHVSTTLMDIDAHQQMRRRGISTRDLGVQSFELDKIGVFTMFTPASRAAATAEYVDGLTGFNRMTNVLLYARYWFAFKKDPTMPSEAWATANKWFDFLPSTKADGQRVVEIIEKNGFDTAEGQREMYRQILRMFKVADKFVLYEGTPWAPTFYEQL